MSALNLLKPLTGKWQGTNQLWFMPDDPVRVSESEASIAEVAQGQSLIIRYTWAFEGQPQDGMLLIVPGAQPEAVKVVLVDSWHVANSHMLFEGGATGNGISVTGSYAAPPGPDWGWRIIIEPHAENTWRMRMYNITPEGEETLAVEATYTRAEK